MKLLLALAISLGGCAVDEQPEGYPAELGTPENPVPMADSYTVQTRVTIALDLPPVTTAVANLRSFSQAAGRALLSRSGTVPAPAWIATLPASLRTNLESYIDAELDKVKFGTKTLRQVTGELGTIAETSLTSFTIESSLAISPTSVVHSLVDLNFTPSSLDIVIPIGGLDADKILQRPVASIGIGGALTLGEQRFSLAFGAHAWHAINLASEHLFGEGVSLVSGVDCGAVGRAVAARCLTSSPTSCVGHASELENACKLGLATLVDDLRTRITPIEIGDVHFASGAARLVDDGSDGIADRIVDGTWDAEMDHGQGARTVTATFVAYD
ncbi:MAG: hypothetical protein ACKV2T_07620 [Kofleriaceae bacterium]